MPDEPADSDVPTIQFCRHDGDLRVCRRICMCEHACSRHDPYNGACRDCGCLEWDERPN